MRILHCKYSAIRFWCASWPQGLGLYWLSEFLLAAEKCAKLFGRHILSDAAMSRNKSAPSKSAKRSLASADSKHPEVLDANADLFDTKEVGVGQLVGHEVQQGVAAAPHTGSSAGAVDHRVRALGRVQLEDPGHVGDVQAPGRHIRAQQAACSPQGHTQL